MLSTERQVVSVSNIPSRKGTCGFIHVRISKRYLKNLQKKIKGANFSFNPTKNIISNVKCNDNLVFVVSTTQ